MLGSLLTRRKEVGIGSCDSSGGDSSGSGQSELDSNSRSTSC